MKMRPCRRCGVPWNSPDLTKFEVCNECWKQMGQRSFEDDETLGFWSDGDTAGFWLDTEEAIELRRELQYWEHG